MSKIVSACAALILLPFVQNKVYAIEYTECIIEYTINSSVKIKNKEEFENCIKLLKNKNIEVVFAIGGATPSGTIKRNKQLAEERLKTTINYINNIFPNVRLKTYNIGVNEAVGKNVYLSFVINNETNEDKILYLNNKIKDLEVELQNQEALLAASEIQAVELQNVNNILLQEKNQKLIQPQFTQKESSHLQVALRGGLDRVYNSVASSNYLSIGSELSWIPSYYNSIYPELGAKFSTSISQSNLFDTQLKDFTNAYGFLGFNTKFKGVIAGGRFLIGKEWLVFSENLKKNYFSTGGELRVGYMFDNNVFIFGNYALTGQVKMAGIDIGKSF